jgi:sigma-B regulation protein RsbU (phosphoserine phosphatase)
MFVTLMICILDVATGELLYVNGGHNRPLLGNAAKGYEYVAQPPGILVGVEPRAEFQVARRILGSGDTLILFTDGVTEANNPLYEEFSEARLLDWANRRAAGTANDLVAGIRLAVQDFAAGAEQSDDLTVLVLRYLGP